MNVVNISSWLIFDPFYKYSVNFNPSILPLNDGKYLMSFQVFRRFGIEETKKLGNEINHPWLGGPYSKQWWTVQWGGFEGIGFLILNNNLTLFKTLSTRIKGVHDMRLISWNGEILATGNKTLYLDSDGIGVDRVTQGLSKKNIYAYGTHIYSMTLRLSTSYDLQVEEHGMLCKNLSTDHEKNWSPWVSTNRELMISYHLNPKHIIFIPGDDLSMCETQIESNSNIFSRITKYYGSQNISFSLSTPAMYWSQTEYIAVGHVKLYPFEEHSYHAMIETRKLSPHPANLMRYYMFFYTFNFTTYKIKKISNAFVPPESETNVIFPVGLVVKDKDVIVSYGDGDNAMKCLIINRNMVETLLFEDLQPEEFKFKLFN